MSKESDSLHKVPGGRFYRLVGLLVLALLASSCSTTGSVDQRTPSWGASLNRKPVVSSLPADEDQADTAARPATDEPPEERPNLGFYEPGSGKFVQLRPASIADADETDGEIKLNFQNANLLEVIKVVLGDMLGLNYVVDPRVQGAVSMQTSRPLPRSALIPTMEMLLRMNEAALITEGDVYRVVPLATAVTGVQAPQLGDSTIPLPNGYSVRIVPLKYIAAEEMAQILEPFVAGANSLLRVDTKRNLLILAGSGGDIERLLETIRVFDVDRMAGMSVALFTPDFVDAATLSEELNALLAEGEQGLMAGMVRFVPIERLNGVLAITPRPDYLAEIRDWVQKLDRDSSGSGRRLFIYRVENGKAVEIADILNNLFETSGEKKQTPRAELAPGLRPASTRSSTPDTDKPADAGSTSPTSTATRRTGSGTSGGEGLALGDDVDVKIIADEPNNALLVLASSQQYKQILSALKQLDVTPLQVVVEVTIAEVTLTDNLQYGVEWFFKTNAGRDPSGPRSGTASLDLTQVAGVNPQVPGFSYLIQSAAGENLAVLNMLASESNISIISSPTLLVLNNQEASIQVGAEVPVTTQQQQSTDTADSNIINSIEYRETGILLNVKPRVNSGGLVIMDVEQEASSVPDDQAGAGLTPRIQQRKLKSTIAINSGDTVILGGLIEDNRTRSDTGVPLLHSLPVVGALFGSKSDNQDRTELLVMITPRVIGNRATALAVTEEFRRKLNSLIPIADEDKDEDKEKEPPSEKAAPTEDAAKTDDALTEPRVAEKKAE